ncbi:hypothetical protein [Bacillus sp. UMB0893]|uniref:hypothetical protein n=1 Tax=Bacillus sp. UMB0893 TaxID=2066053 RepID=UPI000C76EAD8|nr:hypothetical protein [Bacillus sp. UMB0893]PLR65985.1 hypothetical protein CYJ36_20130 [Bacillus sp. UMB0893]
MEFKQPGEGAVLFAQQFTDGLTIDEALPIIGSLLNGELHDVSDKRIKRCGHCNYFYRDQTKPNNSRTCSRACKIDQDTEKRRMKKADEALLSPKKKTKREENYVYWLEYPFWLDEYEMLKQSWKPEVSYCAEKIEVISAAKQRDEILGGKRKPKRVVPYNGREAV